MWDWIERQRKKSRKERTRIAFFMSIALTAVIGLVWGTAILPRTLMPENRVDSRAESTTPFKTLSESFGVMMSDIRNGIGSIGEMIDLSGATEEDSEVTEVEDVEGDFLNMGTRGELVPEAAELNEHALEEEGVEINDTSSTEVFEEVGE